MTTQNASAVAAVYFGTFAGGANDHATWTTEGWRRAGRAPTADDLVAARSDRPLSLYFLGPDGHGHVAALDADGPDGVAKGRALGRLAWDRGIPAYIEESASGAHVWVSLTERLSAPMLRRGLLALTTTAGLSGDVTVELRPSTDRAGSLGGCLRAPMTVSPKSWQCSPLLDPRSGRSLHEKVAGALLRNEQADPAAWIALAESWQPPEPVRPTTTPVGGHSDGPIAAFNAAVTVSAVLVREYGVERASPGRSVRCPRHDDRNPSLSILPDDRRVVCHANSCELSGRGADAYALWQLAQERTAA